jgi:hypothetical protein
LTASSSCCAALRGHSERASNAVEEPRRVAEVHRGIDRDHALEVQRAGTRGLAFELRDEQRRDAAERVAHQRRRRDLARVVVLDVAADLAERAIQVLGVARRVAADTSRTERG